MTSQELVQGCLRGDKAYQKLLYCTYASKMFAVCLRYARSREEAQDILQDGFVKVFGKLGSYRNEGSLEGWIRRIMVNTAISSYHKSSQLHEVRLEIDFDKDDEVPGIIERLTEKELIKMLQGLPDGYRVIFNLYAIEGFSHAEIAAQLGITESTSRSQLTKARKYIIKNLIEQLIIGK